MMEMMTDDDDDDDDWSVFQRSGNNWMTGEAEIPATLAFLDIAADISISRYFHKRGLAFLDITVDISYFYEYIFPLKDI